MAVPVKVLVSEGRFPIECVRSVLSGLCETNMSRKGMDTSVLRSLQQTGYKDQCS